MQPQFSQLSPNEQEVFRLYKGNSPFEGEQCFADHVNQSLRDRKELAEPWNEQMELLDAIIERACFNEQTTCFRATVDHFVSPYIVGQEIVYPAYMSTTTDDSAVQNFFSGSNRDVAAALLRVDCPPEYPALDFEINQAFGGHEREFLLPRNSRFKIVSLRDIDDRDEMNAHMTAFFAKHYSSLKIYDLEYLVRI